MNAKTLKIIAIITMAIDHIGLYLLIDNNVWYPILRSIGRISFPLFAFLIAEGFFHTKNLKKYFLRLLSFALLIEAFLIGYSLFIHQYDYIIHANVIWPLVVGLACLYLVKLKKWYFYLLALGMVILSELIKFPYGAYGVILILIFGYAKKFPLQVYLMIYLNLFFIDWPLLKLVGVPDPYIKYMWLQWFSILALIPIYFYNGLLGKSKKWFFYVFYPVHLGIIFLIKVFMEMI
ncbi:MAG: conjugal transfer protein TraX [Firmicutes bacterium]|nr:conjugal transfer protein TraX [Bacillota bacterium]